MPKPKVKDIKLEEKPLAQPSKTEVPTVVPAQVAEEAPKKATPKKAKKTPVPEPPMPEEPVMEAPQSKKKSSKKSPEPVQEASQSKKKSSKKSPEPVQEADVKPVAEEKKPKKSKKTKDPNAPKKNVSSYIFFTRDVMSEVKAQNSDREQKDIMKLIATMWKELSQDQKVKYEDQAKLDKKRYEEESSSYVAPPKAEQETKKKKEKSPVKKNLNAYNFYSKERLPVLKAENAEFKNTDLMKMVAADWKNLSDKSKYEVLAQQDKLRYENELKAVAV